MSMTNRDLQRDRNGYNEEKGIKLQSNQTDRDYRNDDRPRDVASVPRLPENMVGHTSACDRKTDGAYYVVLYRRGIPLHPKRKEVYRQAVCFCSHIALRIQLCWRNSVYSERILQYDQRYVVACVVRGIDGHIHNGTPATMDEDRIDHFDLLDHLSFGLVISRGYVSGIFILKPREFQKAIRHPTDMDCHLCSRILCLYGQSLRNSPDVHIAVSADSEAV